MNILYIVSPPSPIWTVSPPQQASPFDNISKCSTYR
ncbi:hypothetical protein BLOT_000681, partial [Blomia tropicalis]